MDMLNDVRKVMFNDTSFISKCSKPCHPHQREQRYITLCGAATSICGVVLSHKGPTFYCCDKLDDLDSLISLWFVSKAWRY